MSELVDRALEEVSKVRSGIKSRTRFWTSDYQEIFPQLPGVDWQQEAWRLWWVR